MPLPPITVTCECGQAALVRYGERWTCPTCGRAYDTGRIPEHEYRERIRVLSRYKLIAFGPLVVIASVMVPLVVFVDPALIFLLGMIAFAYILLYVPFIRRRSRRWIGPGTSWDLRAD